MKILITNAFLALRRGSEVFTSELAHGLQGRGHAVCVYAPVLGPLAVSMQAAGLAVTDDLDGLPWVPEVIHGQHCGPTTQAALAFPRVPVVNVCHGALPVEEQPCLAPNVRLWVAVDEPCRTRLFQQSAATPAQVRWIPNAVPLDLYPARTHFPTVARRALVFGNSASAGSRLQAIREAGAAAGLSVDCAGVNSGQVAEEPWQLLPQYDVVFAKARCAMEAMACGCRVILSDAQGLGPVVTPAGFPQLLPWNFGFRLLHGQHDRASVQARLTEALAMDAAAVMQQCRATLGWDAALGKWEAVYAEAVALGGATPEALLRFARSLTVAPLGPPPPPPPPPTKLRREGYGVERHRAKVFEKICETALRAPRHVPALLHEHHAVLTAAERARCQPLLRRALPEMPVPPLIPFVVSYPRSGSTWLRLTLDAHPQLTMLPETGFIPAVCTLTSWGSGLREQFFKLVTSFPVGESHFADYQIPPAALQSALEAVQPFTLAGGLRAFYALYAQRQGKPLAGDKTPIYIRALDQITELLPEARIIHLVREPRDAVASYRRQRFAPTTDVAALATQWASDVQLARAFGRSATHWLEVSYEALVLDRETTLRRICAYLELPWSAAMLQHESSAATRLAAVADVCDPAGQIIVSAATRHALHHPATQPPLPSRIGQWQEQLTTAEAASILAIAGGVQQE